VAAPVFGRGINRDDLRHDVARLESGQERAALAGHPIERRGIGEREQASDRAGRVERRLPEALIELAPAGARDVRDHAVEHLPPPSARGGGGEGGGRRAGPGSAPPRAAPRAAPPRGGGGGRPGGRGRGGRGRRGGGGPGGGGGGVRGGGAPLGGPPRPQPP